jgi:hypothetical protein
MSRLYDQTKINTVEFISMGARFVCGFVIVVITFSTANKTSRLPSSDESTII